MSISVVLDNGSLRTRAGFSGEPYPRVVCPTFVAKVANQDQEFIFAEDAEDTSRHNAIKRAYPIEYGDIYNWEYLEKFWHYILEERLQVDASNHPLIVTEKAMSPKYSTEKTAEVMMETFSVPWLYIATGSAMTLRACGKSTGVVYQAGHGYAQVLPFYEGCLLAWSAIKSAIEGMALTSYLSDRLKLHEKHLSYKNHIRITEDILQKHCCVMPVSELIPDTSQISYNLGNNESIQIGEERYQVGEIMVNPGISGLECGGVQECIEYAIKLTDKDLWPSLYSNIVLSGGPTKLPGLDRRLRLELIKLKPGYSSIIDVSQPCHPYPEFLGASTLPSEPNFLSSCLSKYEYDEYGPRLVHKKFI